MGTYYLRKEGSEYRVSSEEAVVRLVQLGLVVSDDRLRRDGEKRFRKASSFRELKASFEADAWSAWEMLGDVDPETLWAESTEWVGGEPAKTPVQSEPVPAAEMSEAVEATPEADPIPEPVPLTKKEPVVEASPEVESPAPLPEEDEDSNVIVFPTPAQGRNRQRTGNAELRPMASFEPPPMPIGPETTVVRRPSPPRQFRAFPWVFGGIAVIGGLVLVTLNSHIKTTANWTSPGPEGPPPEQVVAEAQQFSPEVEVVADEAAVPELDEVEVLFRAKTKNLRERLSRGVTEMRGQPDDLTNALMIEMSRMRVGLLMLKAPVHAWGGPQNDLPVAADVHIVMNKQDDLIEQLGAAVLVVGKYLQAYEMELQEFIVGIQEPSGIVQERTISAEGASAVFSNRLSLRDLLTE